MRNKIWRRAAGWILSLTLLLLPSLTTGCSPKDGGQVTIELLQHKIEAISTFEALAKKFEAENQDIQVIISTPNEPTTILKTRLIKENPPDMAALGGDRAYADFVDADIFADISEFSGLSRVQDSYLQMDKDLELIPKEGIFAVPYAANANGILYNKEIFDKYGWQLPKTWDELLALCETIQAAGVTPLMYSLKDTWNALPSWNSIDGSINEPELFQRVNVGEESFENAYSLTADKVAQLLTYGRSDKFSLGYNDGCTAFARGEAAMYAMGSFAVPQIKTVNPDIEIGMFVMPTNNDPEKNLLNSGIDLQFMVMKDSPHKEACLKFIEFLLREDNMQQYADEQSAIPCLKGEYRVSGLFDNVLSYLERGKIIDFPDHHYPAEMPMADLIQTYLMNGDKTSFLQRVDKEWVKNNRDLIARAKEAAGKS